MGVDVRRELARALGTSYPSAIRRIVGDVASRPPGANDRSRAQQFAALLKRRGVRNVNATSAASKVVTLLKSDAGARGLCSAEELPVLQEIAKIWLEEPSKGVAFLTERFEVSAAGVPVEPPSRSELDAVLDPLVGRAQQEARAAALALLCAARLGSRLTRVASDGSGEAMKQTAMTVEQRAEMAPAIATMLDTLNGLEANDPAWSEMDAFVEAVTRRAQWASEERERTSLRARAVELLDGCRGRYGEWLDHLGARLPGAGDVGPGTDQKFVNLCEVAAGRLAELERPSAEAGDSEIARHRLVQKRLAEARAAIDALWTAIGPASPGAGDASSQVKPATVVTTGAAPSGPTPPVPAPRPHAVKPPTPAVTKPGGSFVNPPPPQVIANPPPPQGVADPPPAPPKFPSIKLPRASSIAEVDRTVVLCLDFGTARSKAMAVRSSGQPVVLTIGKIAKADLEHSIASSVWLDRTDGRVHFGDDAIRRSHQQGQIEQQRIDSLKDIFSTSTTIGDRLPDPDGRLLPVGTDRTGHAFTVGEILVLYLGFLSWAAEEGLRAAKIGSEPVRRFAIPSWDHAHRKSGVEMLRTYLARATLLSRYVGGRWTEGIPFEEAKALARAALKTEAADLPLALFEKGITEPLAAVGTRTEELAGSAGLVMVIDIGAGTTDYGLFLVMGPERQRKYIEVATHSISVAGNHLDLHLRRYIMKKLFGAAADVSQLGADLEIQLSQRQKKEELFSLQRTTVKLQSGHQCTLRLADFLANSEVQDFEAALVRGFYDTFKKAEEGVTPPGYGVDWQRYASVRVVLTGGGARLPMVQSLAKQSFRVFRNPGFERLPQSIERKATLLLPRSVAGYGLLEDAYLPLAVAWGGAIPELPTEGKPVELGTIRPPGYKSPVETALIGQSEDWRAPVR